MAMFAALQRNGYRGFILSPDETLAARTAVLNVTSRGVPVVIVDDELGPPPSGRLSYVSNDEAAGSRLAAQELAGLLHGHGAIAVTGINPRSETSLSREQQVEKAMAATAPGIRIALRRFGDTVLTHQQQIAQEVMSQPEHIDAIVALSAAATRGAYYARLASASPKPLVIIGFDQDLLLPLQTNGIDAIVAQDTRTIGQIAMRNLASQMHGEPVQGLTLVPPLLLTRASLQTPAARRLLAYPAVQWSGQ
jgi:ribose transport system substrate-binding protein